MIPEDITPEQAAGLVTSGRRLLSEDVVAKLDKVEFDAILGVSPPSGRARGPRRPRVDNPRALGSASHVEVPAKDERKRRNKAQRQARKANR